MGLFRLSLEGEAVAAEMVFRGFVEPSIEKRTETLPDGGVKVVTIERAPDPRIALSWLERRAGSRWNPAHRVALGQDPDASPIVTYMLPDNGRDTTPAPDGGDPSAPTDSRP